jgi:hypothetical protein
VDFPSVEVTHDISNCTLSVRGNKGLASPATASNKQRRDSHASEVGDADASASLPNVPPAVGEDLGDSGVVDTGSEDDGEKDKQTGDLAFAELFGDLFRWRHRGYSSPGLTL